jgi:hypothetical protein
VYLAQRSEEILKEEPDAALDWLLSQVERPGNLVIEGIRSPRDLLALARPGDRVLDLGGEGTHPWERLGLATCRDLKAWLVASGVSWSSVPPRSDAGNFARLPRPVRVGVPREYLKRGAEGEEPGFLVALESDLGEPVTGMFLADCGGMFHDLPMAAFMVACVGTLVGEGECYSVADVGHCIVEQTIIDTPYMTIFGRDRCKRGYGRALATVHWPAGNTLLWLISAGGRLLLWPPHKLLLDADAVALPDWEKKR